jgi:hypothetical protein
MIIQYNNIVLYVEYDYFLSLISHFVTHFWMPIVHYIDFYLELYIELEYKLDLERTLI